MKNKLVLIVALLVCAAVLYTVWYSRGLREQIDAAAQLAPEAERLEDSSRVGEGVAGMSISGMEIVQGEAGHELWRLVAKGAVMSEEGGDIIAEDPHLTYYMHSEEGAVTEIYVESLSGDVNQQKNIIRFIDEVVVTRQEDVLETTLLIYDGPNNRLDCPEESQMVSPGMNGTARSMSLHLDDNTLHASGGVSLNLDTTRKVLAE